MVRNGQIVRRIASHFTLTPQGLLPGIVVTANNDGDILDVSTASGIDSRYGVEFYSGVLIPGMVNSHSHLELSYLRGAIEPQSGFAGFAAGMARMRNQFTDVERRMAMEYRDSKMWRDGIQAVVDISNGDSSLKTKAASKIFYHTFFELFELSTNSTSHIADLLAEARRSGLSASATPHSLYSLNAKMLSEVVAMTPEAPLSIHFMESRGESDLFDRLGELWEWYEKCGFECDFLDCESPVDRLIATVPSHRRVMLIHNTMISEEAVDKIVDHFGDQVTFVLCPLSNHYITGLMPPVEMLRRKGVRIAVGTDSLASNDTLSMIDELKCFDNVPLDELLMWATSAGADAMGVGHRYGRIEVGNRAGLVLMEGIDMNARRLTATTTTRRLV